MVDSKECSCCKEIKDKLCFYKDSRAKSKLSSKCKECHKQYKYPPRKEYMLQWRAENAEHLASYGKDYRKRNKDSIYSKNNARHSRVKQAIAGWANMQSIRGTYKLARYLSETYGKDIHVDHIIPLNGKLVSGLHVEDNLQLVYAKDNLKKGNAFHEQDH